VIGGTSLSGGVGSVGGTLVGVLIIGVLNNIMGLNNVDANLQLILKGVIILGAVWLQRRRGSKMNLEPATVRIVLGAALAAAPRMWMTRPMSRREGAGHKPRPLRCSKRARSAHRRLRRRRHRLRQGSIRQAPHRFSRSATSASRGASR
jgi:hypothetical protein